MPKAAATTKTFTVILEHLGLGLNWVIARVPFDPAKAWPERNGRRVRGTIEGFPFRTSLMSLKNGGGPFFIVNKKMLAGANAQLGGKVRIVLEPDMEERPAETPPELARELKPSRLLQRWYLALSPSMRREIAKWITEPEALESRRKRAVKMAERLMQAMEGESAPPPVLRAAFERQPLARAGWLALTPVQRRNHLLGIFYYESAEARAGRAAKAIEDALKAARKKAERRVRNSAE